ncbi:P-loop NTPase family protein [Salinarchaeum chitinilyticum]
MVAHSSIPELPDLSAGIQLLDAEPGGALPALVADQVLTDGKRALWADAGRQARTRRLADVAPSPRILERIDVARGFTAFQHYAIVERLVDRARQLATEDRLALVVAPALDAPYREDGLRGDEGATMLVRAIARLAGIAREAACPVLVTRRRDDALSAPIANAAADTIRCEHTEQGPRFEAEDFETLVYPVGDGLLQTTLAYWRRILDARAPEGALEPVEPTISMEG